LIDSNQKFKITVKDRLFYNQFNYCLGFKLNEVNCLRELDHERIDWSIDRRKTWREITRQRINQNSYVSTLLMRRVNEITEDTVKNLHTVADILLTSDVKYKLVVTVNHAHVYTNNLELLEILDKLTILSEKTYTQAHVSRPKDTVQLKNSCHTQRSYFKSMQLSIQQKENLENFLYNQRDYIRASPGLKRWTDLPFVRVQDYYFIDHSGTQWITMLNLVVPGLIRKSMQIITAK
jgi:hypothetical protein